jgi:hypothetical protein
MLAYPAKYIFECHRTYVSTRMSHVHGILFPAEEHWVVKHLVCLISQAPCQE